MYKLYQARYLMNMGCGGDIWGLHGKVYNKPGFKDGNMIMVSTPISFDEENMILETYSGSKYHIKSFDSPKDDVIKQIKKDITNKS